MTIAELEKEIEYEENQYKIACEYPTENAQFYRGLENSRKRIESLKQKLIELKNPKKMAQEKIFADGLRIEPAGPKAPEWVKGKISVFAPKFIEFLQKHQSEKGWVNFDIKKSKSGVTYVELNTWKPNQQPQGEVELGEKEEAPKDDIKVDDLF